MKRRILSITVIFFLLTAITVYSSSLITSREESEVSLSFTTEEYLADYDKLWEILDENYFYFPYLEKHGVTIEALKADTRRQLESRIHDTEGFYYLLEIMFRKMHNFAHLGMVDTAVYATYQKYYAAENVPDNGWKKVLQNPQTQAIYACLEEAGTSKAVQKDGSDFLPDIEASYDEAQNAVIFKISSFNDRIYERDRQMIAEYLATVDDRKIDHIIFDIRGNPGGNDKYWWDNIVGPFGGTYEWVSWCYLRDTELMQDYFFHDFQPEPVSTVQGHNVPPAVEEFGLTHYFTIPRKLSSDTALKKELQNARRWVIIDEQVYSSADSFASFCKNTGWATLVGKRTKGDGEGVAPVLITLPETGLLVRFSGIAVESSDGGINAVTGTGPDIQINTSNEDVYDEIYRIIQSNG